MQTLDLAVMRTLLAAVETGSFAGAARKVGRSESAVSLQLKRLEEQIGEPVFLRAGKQMTLTGAGARLVEYARRLLDLNDEALSAASESSTDGTVTLGVPHDVTETWLPAVIEGFRRSHPSATLKVVEGRSAILLSRLADDQIDLAIVFSAKRPENAVWSADLPRAWIGRDDYGLKKMNRFGWPRSIHRVSFARQPSLRWNTPASIGRSAMSVTRFPISGAR